MKALGKILGLVILGLLLLIVALGFALTHLFDPNDYKDEIRTLARDKAGLELNIAGDIGWSLFPWLGLELHDTTLASVQTPEQPFADLRMLGLSVRVLPLLSREVEMSDITLNGLNLTLNRDEKGRGNWEGVGRLDTSETPPGATPPAEAAEPGDDEQTADNAKRPLQLDIDSLTISDARVTYHDAQTGQQFSAEGIELTTGAIREATSIPVKLNAFFGSNKPVMRARTELQGALRFDTKLQRYQLEDLRLSGEASGEPLQGKTLSFSAQGQLLADLAADIAEWTSLKFTANQLRGLGELKARDLQDQPKITGALSIAEFNLREFLESIGQQLPAMADNTALGKAELVTRLAGTPTSLTFEEINLKLDGSTFTGQIAVSDFAKQALRVDLSGDQLNLDRYLPPPAKEDSAGAARQSEVKVTQAAVSGSGTTPLPDKPTQQAWSSTTALPVSALRNLDTRINLSIDNLTAMKLPVDNFAVKARTAGGLLTLEQLRGGLYNGRVEASASLDVRPQVPLITAQTRLARVPIEGLLQSQGEEVVIKGLLNLDSDIRTQGNSQQAWIDNLNGKIGFIIDNGILVDANLEQQLCRAIAPSTASH
jgi:AsmA protein